MIYIFVKYEHWLIISLLMKKYNELEDKKVAIVVLSQSAVKYFENIDLRRGKNLFSIKDFNNSYEQKEEDEFILHHSKQFINQLEPYISSYKLDKIKISFYADGFANRFLNHEEVSYFCSTYNTRIGSIYFFDQKRVIPTHLDKYEVVVINALILHDIFEMNVFKQMYTNIKDLLPKEEEQSVLILLRPWGSDSFQSGQFSMDKNVLIEFIRSIRLLHDTNGKTSKIYIRPDYRDGEYMNFIHNEILKIFPDVFMIDDNIWPVWQTFDPFLYHFSKRLKNKIILVCSDSTAASPFITSNILKEVDVGVTELVEKKYFLNTSPILSKIKMLERIYNEYSKNIGHIKKKSEYFFQYVLEE